MRVHIILNFSVSGTQILGIIRFCCLCSGGGAGLGSLLTVVLLLHPSLIIIASRETWWAGKEWLQFHQPTDLMALYHSQIAVFV